MLVIVTSKPQAQAVLTAMIRKASGDASRKPTICLACYKLFFFFPSLNVIGECLWMRHEVGHSVQQ